MGLLNRRIFLYPLCVLAVLLVPSAGAQTVPVFALDQSPELDGNDSDWEELPFVHIPLRKTKPNGITRTPSVAIKAATHGDRLYVFVEWDDDAADTLHKPWIWDKQLAKYVRGPQREDRLAIHFSQDKNYSTDWRSGAEFTADTWHWKASRSNPLNLAHDKSLKISRNKMLRAYKMKLPSGDSLYIKRPSDSGSKIYKTKRYRRFQQEMMPKYLLNESPGGSVADVAAKGVWSKGKWRLELSRKLNTENEDDVALPSQPGQLLGGIAVFNRSENDDHAISETLTFDFKYTRRKPN